jgi:uncharacterized protein with beta-barrel porin domain
MIFDSGASQARRGSDGAPANAARLRRAVQAGAILGASALSLAPVAALAADFLYWGDSTYSQAFGAGRLLTDAVSTEMSRFTESADGSALSYADDQRITNDAFKHTPRKVEPIEDGRVWVEALGGVANMRAHSATSSPAERASNYGVAAGVDAAVDTGLRIGFAMSGGQSALKVDSLATKADATWGLAAFYGVATDGATYAKTSLTIGYITTETERTVAAEKATGTYDSVLYAARVEIGQRLDTKRVGVTPFLAVEPSLVARNGYTETAAPAIALGFDKSTASAVPGTLGVKIDGVINFRNLKLTPSATVGWVHNFASTASITPFFASLPSSTFTVVGVKGDRNLARTELSIEATRGGSAASVFASTRADFGERTTSVRGAGGMMMRF